MPAGRVGSEKLFARDHAYGRGREAGESAVVHRRDLGRRPAECAGGGCAREDGVGSVARLKIVEVKECRAIAHFGMRQDQKTIGWIGRRHFKKTADQREIWVYHLESSRQRVFQRDVILFFARVDPVGNENLIADFKWCRCFSRPFPI